MSFRISAYKALMIDAETFLHDDPIHSGGGFLVEAIPFIEAGKFLLAADHRTADFENLPQKHSHQLYHLASDILMRLPLGKRTKYPEDWDWHSPRLLAVDHPAFPAFECKALTPGTIYFDVNSDNFENPPCYGGILSRPVRKTRDLRAELLKLISQNHVSYFEHVYYAVRALSTFRNKSLDLLDDLTPVADDFVRHAVLSGLSGEDLGVSVTAVSEEWGTICGGSSKMESGKRYIAFNWQTFEPGESWSDPRENKGFMKALLKYMKLNAIPASALFEESCHMGG